jgi:hypothetical protein
MIHQELLFYVKEQQKRGVPNAEIKEVLMREGGWVEADIDEVFRFIVAPIASPAPSPVSVAASPASVGVKPIEVSAPQASMAQPVVAPTPATSTSASNPVTSATASAPLMAPLTQPKPSDPLSPYAPTKAGTVPAFSGMETKVMLEKAKPVKHRGRLAGILTAIFVLVILGGGGAYAYTTYVNPAPEAAFSHAYAAFTKAPSFRFSLETSVKNLSANLLSFLPAEKAGEAPEVQEVSNEATSKFSLSGTVVPGNASQFNVTGSFVTPLLPVTVAFQAKTERDAVLLKFPNLGYFIERFNLPNETQPETWYTTGSADIEKALAAPQFALLRAFAPVISNTGNASEVAALLQQSPVIVPTTALPRASEGGKTYLRYQFTVNEDALKQVALNLIQKGQGAPATVEQVAEIDRMLEALTFSDGELWIAPLTFSPHKISFTALSNQGSVVPFESLSFALTLSGYGEALSTEVVPNPMPLTDVIQSAILADKNARVLSLISQSRVQAEMYYGKVRSYRNLCTRSTELATTFNEIKNSTGTNPVCIATAKAYAIAAPLPGDAAQVACVDSAGMNGQVSALPTKAVCE